MSCPCWIAIAARLERAQAKKEGVSLPPPSPFPLPHPSTALLSSRCDSKEGAPDQSEQMREQAVEILMAAAENGQLEVALQALTKDRFRPFPRVSCVEGGYCKRGFNGKPPI